MMKFEDEAIPHRKKSKKKTPKKSKHKHDYELIEKEKWVIDHWFDYRYVCTICGKTYTEVKIDR